MTIAPVNNRQGFDLQTFLSDMSGAIGNNRANQEQDLNRRHLEAVFEANPNFAMAQQRTINSFDATQEELRKKSALTALAKQLQSGQIDKNQALVEYAGITGDYSAMFGSGSRAPASIQIADELAAARAAGDTERVNDIIMSGKLADKGVIYDPTTGQYTDAAGYGGALGELGRQENFGKETGTLQAQGELKPDVEADIVTAKSNALFMEEGKQKLPQVKRALEAAELRDKFLNEKIDSIATRATPWTTGFKGALASAVPGSPAYDLKADVETLLANSGFDRLQEMRDNSPTGGALGQVSERELGLLQAAAQNLQTSQSEEQFKRNLAAFKKQRESSLKAVRAAYQDDLARFGKGSMPADSAAAPKRRKYNPQTGTFE